MSQPSDSNKPSESDDQWHQVFNGQRLPQKQNAEEHEADVSRQVLLWRHAQRNPQPISTQEAELFYWRMRDVERQRRRKQWLRLGLLSVGLLAVGAMLVYVLSVGDAVTTTNMTPESVPESSAASLSESMIKPIPMSQSQPARILDGLPEMRKIPAGEFTMGCTAGWDDVLGGCRENEYPAHHQAIQAFHMSKHEVTVGQFRRFVAATAYKTVAEQDNNGCTIAAPDRPGTWVVQKGYSWRQPGFEQTDNHPVVCIAWEDAVHYSTWLAQETGKPYRLPTEPEWEYAARAGKITAFYWGSQASRSFANYQGQGAQDRWQYTAPVGQFTGNSFGLHDMAGNAWEWVAGCANENYTPVALKAAQPCDTQQSKHVRRGGAWDTQPPSIRSAYRSIASGRVRSEVYGFRVAY